MSTTAPTSETSFSLEYIISVGVALGAAFMINRNSPSFSPVITFFVVPLLVAYVTLQILNFVFPSINTMGNNASSYIQYGTMDTLSNMGYMQVFPPLFAVLVVTIILLYSRRLG